MFKVGDEVVFKSKEDAEFKSERFTKGTVYTVLEVEGIDIKLTRDDGVRWWVVADRVMAKPAAKPKKKAAPKKTAKSKPTPGVDPKFTVIGQDENKKFVELAVTNDIPLLLIGETGTGKTSLVREQAIINKKELVRFSITGETTVDEFVGKYELESGETVWKDGILIDAMKTGKWLVADEINVALPEILFVLHSLLDDDKQITVSNHLGEVIKPHKDFRFFATMNPPEEYAGTKELNKAFQSRFSIVLTVHYPAPEIETRILVDKAGIIEADAVRMVDVANALREAKKQDKIFYTCSTRDLLHWADVYSKGIDANDAFKVAVLNKTGQDHTAITDIYKTIIGDYVALDTPDVTLTVEWFKAQKKALVAERDAFEANKTKVREEITADIVKKLTGTATEVISTKELDVPTKEATDGIFKD